jgi:tetratricopeptide (TPR) repeat protein
LQLNLATTPPQSAAERERWAGATVDLAFGRWQNGSQVDAEQALRRLDDARIANARACFLRGEMALAAQNKQQASEFWNEGLKLGGEDYRARFALGRLAQDQGEIELAETHYLAAEKDFPGFDEPNMSAELALAALYQRSGRPDDEEAARSRWLRWNSGEYEPRMKVAAWHAKAERWSEAEKLYSEANEVDPFRRKLHAQWAAALEKLGRHADALREYEVTARIPRALDADKPEELTSAERADLLGLQANCLIELGRTDAALARIQQALALDADCKSAKSARARLP